MWRYVTLFLFSLFCLVGCANESQSEISNREECKYIDYLLPRTYENIAGLVAQNYSAEDSIRLMKSLEAERIERNCNKYNPKD